MAVVLLLPAIMGMPGFALAEGDHNQPSATESFRTWLGDFEKEALAKGISQKTLNRAFTGVKPIDRVIELDRSQPEFTRTFWDYIERGVNRTRIDQAKQLMKKHEKLLDAVYRKYGVPPRFLVAFWGMETNFGQYFGGFPVIGALATLAYDDRRADYFRGELIYALEILDRGHIDPDRMLGSWAGAMGHTQFMPSTFINYAVDGDGDGKIDIWNSLPDVFYSAAHYLSSVGWNRDETWGREVRLPTDFDLDLASMSVKKPLSQWAALGVKRADGSPLPEADMDASIVLPAGHKGPGFLVYNNFRTIMVWNRSVLYAIAIGHLADRMIGLPPLVAKKPADDRPIARTEIIAMQTALNEKGFDTGKPDGMVGPKTREALREYQKSNGLPADGYPTPGIIASIVGKASDADAAGENGGASQATPAN